MTNGGSLTIRQASIVDPDAETVQENTRIRIESGVVVEVSPDPGGPVASAEVDAAGLYAVPGLIDCHVHVIAHTADEHALTMEPPSYVTARAAVELRAMLGRGFTAVRDMAGADCGLARAVAEGGLAHGLAPESHAKVFEVLEGGLRALELADRAGVPIAFGTDLLGPLRARQSEEFRIRTQVQTPAAILRSATTVAARVLGQGGRLGVIAPKACGDLILTRHDPLADITRLAEPAEEIALVVQAGVPVSR